MNKEEVIARYGEAEYERRLAQKRAWYKEHQEEAKARKKRYREDNPEKIKESSYELNRKGGKYYDKNLKDQHTGIPGDKCRIRAIHANQYRPYKQIIAPESQIHHEWIPDTSEYRGVALVEADQHMHGFVDVIEILYGKITLLTEDQIKKSG